MYNSLTRQFCLLVLMVVATSEVKAENLDSEFGFETKVPSGWLILSRAELRENPDLFAGLSKTPGLERADPKVLSSVRTQIQSGNIEMLFRTEGSEPGFTDNINIVKQIGKVPQEEEIQDYCIQVETQLAAAFGRPITLYECMLASDVPLHSVYIEYDGVIEGTRSMAYQVRKSDNINLVITATAANGTAKDVRTVLTGIVKDLRLK